jgi:DNA-binding IclR family transcriptional regulator
METESHHLRTLITGVRIIQTLKNQKRLGVTEIEQRTGIRKSSVYKYLDTLEHLGYVKKENKKYALSLQWFDLGKQVRNQHSIVEKSIEELDTLSHKTGETVSLVLEENGDAVYAYQTSAQAPTAPVEEGKRMPAPVSVGGKAICAYRSSDELLTILEQSDVPEDADDVLDDLGDIHSRRIVIDKHNPAQNQSSAGALQGHRHVVGQEEPYNKLHSIATPIRNSDQHAVAAIEINGTESSLYGRRLEDDIASLIVTTAQQIETRLI